ncbi:DUF4102 domain-containing protein [Bartonella sp. B1099]|uniref:DUF4102 domain-containing protein n=1 Tax=Bartonella sp. B1099 TaxID=2911422 RepID=UPI0020C59E5C|nr:DUF4102 domain-containing protein [Bartonella sp. B1099]
MNRLNARSVTALGAGKYNDGAGLLLHKRYRHTNLVCKRQASVFMLLVEDIKMRNFHSIFLFKCQNNKISI